MRLAVFASGGGSNLGAIAKAIEAGQLTATLAVVITDRRGIGALERAASRNIPSEVIATASLPDTASFSTALLDALARHEVDVVALAGYLKKIPSPVVAAYRHRILNIHPSLLPAFGGPGLYGERVHRAVIEYGAQFSGATVHLVDDEYDTGPVVLQQTVPVYEDDTPSALAARVLKVEHDLYPLALQLLADGRLSISGRFVRIRQ